MTILAVITSIFCFLFGFVLANVLRDEVEENADQTEMFLTLNPGASIIRNEEGKFAVINLTQTDINDIPNHKWTQYLRAGIFAYRK